MNYCQKRYIVVFLTVIFLTLAFHYPCKACTAFCIDKGGALVIGKTYDWGFGEGMVVINKKNQTKTALRYFGEGKQHLAQWRSKYGSITFVQFGREIASGGMNEAGLVVNMLMLEGSQYPAADTRPSISVDQYVQYLLDNFQSVDEIAASNQFIRLRPVYGTAARIHFFAVDSTGNSVVIEFLDGKMVIHTKKIMPVKVITNDTYKSSINYLKYSKELKPDSFTSLDRFVNASLLVSKYKPENPEGSVAYAFNVLDSVSQGSLTKFKIVFDVKNRVIYFKSLLNPKLRYFHFDSFDFSPQTPSKMLDINADLEGDVTAKFDDYSTEVNEALIKKAYDNVGYYIFHYPPALQTVSHYPETFINN